ncbi:hypothetical protein FACS1894125_1070 [Actinomycetota bacterium]|nr:hypothetical protein FACS1894125_1070 [Actinomycetota bacterium]
MLPEIFRAGQNGIYIYFILVGFVICASLFGRYEFEFKYIVKTAYKIIIYYASPIYFTIALVLVVCLITAPSLLTDVVYHDLFYSMLLIENFSSFSDDSTNLFANMANIDIVIQFYIIFIFIFLILHFLLSKRVGKKVFAVIYLFVSFSLFFVVITKAGEFSHNGDSFFYINVCSALFLGSVLGVIPKSIHKKKETFVKGFRLIVSLLGLSVVVISLLVDLDYLNFPCTLIGTCLVIIARLGISPNERVDMLLDNVAMHYLGYTSYALLLIYWPAFLIINTATQYYVQVKGYGWAVLTIICLAICIRLLVEESIYRKIFIKPLILQTIEEEKTKGFLNNGF